MSRASELVEGFEPENELEAALAADEALLEGLAWGKPRDAHPEGAVGAHVSELLREIERRGEQGELRSRLRFIALVHDSFKNRVRTWLPRSGENHHAMRARRFAQGLTDDERLLAAIELHDRPYALWKKMRKKGRLDEAAFDEMLERIPDHDLFMRFIEIDGAGEAKDQEPIRWFREQLERRGLVQKRAA